MSSVVTSTGLAHYHEKMKTLLNGKANSSHTHNYAGSSSPGGGANTLYIPRVFTDANYQPGANCIQAKEFANSSTNIPDANWYHILTGQGQDANYNTQLALGMTAQYMYYRYRDAGTWQPWKKIAFTDSDITGNASSATKLATARTINGTSFDGSSNITTANWGTARNIYISDSDGTNTGSSVSVNGSGNATLKLPSIIKASLSGNASSATKLNSYCVENYAYVTNDTHILKLGYLKCTSEYDNLVLLISSSFWGNQHGSVDIISIYQDTNANATPKVQCDIKRVRLNSSRVFYYVKDDTNLRLYLYVYVTGGNSYGRWRTSVIQSEGGSWVSEYAINQTLSNKTEITDQLSPVDHTHSVMTNSEIDALF